MGVNEKLQELIDLLTTTNGKLDLILAALGTPPAPPTYTIDDLYAILSDIKLDTAGVVVSTEGTLGALTGPEGTDALAPRDNVAWNLWHLRHGSVPVIWPPAAINSIQTEQYSWYLQYQNDMTYITGRMNDIANYMMYGFINLGLSVSGFSDNYTGWLFDMRDLAIKVQATIGVPASAFNIPPVGYRDIVQLLSVIQVMPQTTMQSGMVPASLCPDSYISVGMAFIPSVFDAWPETVWASFPDPPPTGVTFGSIFGLSVDYTELVPTAGNWNDWVVFVASDAANFGMAGNVETEFTNRYPTNTWLTLDGNTDNLAFFVGGENSIRVYLCYDWLPSEAGPGLGGGGPWGAGGTGTDNSQLLTSTLVDIAPRAFTKDTNHVIVVPGYFDSTNTITWPGNPPYTYDHNVIWIIDIYGWTIEFLDVDSPAQIQTAWITTGGDPGFFTETVPSVRTMTVHTSYFLICNPQNDTEPTGQFTIKMTPP